MRSKFQKYALAACAAVAAVGAVNLSLNSLPPAHADTSSLSSSELQTLISSGASLQFDASRFTAGELANLAISARDAGNQPTNLTLVNLNKFSNNDLMTIASAGKGHVMFILDK